MMREAVKEILKNNVFLEDNEVPVVIRNLPLDNSPCINILEAANEEIRGTKRMVQLPSNDGMVQALRKEYSAVLQVHIWCDTETERFNLKEQINYLFDTLESNHYRWCSHYDKITKQCSSIQDVCPVPHMETSKTVKNKCPDTDLYNYQNWFQKHHIKKNTFYRNQGINIDILDTEEPILHTIFTIDFEYNTYHIIGGKTSKNIIIHEDLL
jgi:hypothetical protein